jgi:hypothetical protein
MNLWALPYELPIYLVKPIKWWSILLLLNFNFKNGLIIKHVDEFDLYKWSKQAFGVTGFYLDGQDFSKENSTTGAGITS